MSTALRVLGELSTLATAVFCIVRLLQTGPAVIDDVVDAWNKPVEGVTDTIRAILELTFEASGLWLSTFTVYGAKGLAGVLQMTIFPWLNRMYFFLSVLSASLGSTCACLAILDTLELTGVVSAFGSLEFRFAVIGSAWVMALLDDVFNAHRWKAEYCRPYELVATFNFFYMSYLAWSCSSCSFRTIYHINVAALIMLARYHLVPADKSLKDESYFFLFRCILLDVCMLELLYAWLYTANIM